MVSKTDMRWLQQMQDDIAKQGEHADGMNDETRRTVERAERHVARIRELLDQGRHFSVDGAAGVVSFRDGTVERLDA